jgi:small subunit ribosomal protein S21
MIIVKVKRNEPIEKAMRRFKRKVETEGVMRELKKRKFHMTRSQKKREKRKLAAKRRRKLARQNKA